MKIAMIKSILIQMHFEILPAVLDLTDKKKSYS